MAGATHMRIITQRTCSKLTQLFPTLLFSQTRVSPTVTMLGHIRSFSVSKDTKEREERVLGSDEATRFRDFLARSKFHAQEEDTFGSMAEEHNIYESCPEDEMDVEEKVHEQTRTAEDKPRHEDYAALIKQLLSEKKLSEAIDVLETKMLIEDDCKPTDYIYNLLIGACGRVGYTEKAFKLFNQMKKRGLAASGPTYTGLFNACAHSPIPGDGLKRAHHLRQLMKEKGYIPNPTNENVMIKAFGRCNDMEAAFEVADEKINNGHTMTDETFAFLLQGCASNKENGFHYAVLVWRKMRQMKIQPSLYNYNLLLRCVRDCGAKEEKLLGNPNSLLASVLRLSSTSKTDTIKQLKQIAGNASDSTELLLARSTDLLASNVVLGSLEGLEEPTKPENRLLLLGGMVGVLSNMKNDGIKPDIKTFSQLLDIIPSNRESEEELLALLPEYRVKPDIDFFNLLMKKRNFRHDLVGAKYVMHLIQDAKLYPSIITFGVISLGCHKREQGMQLLNDMQEAGFRPNVEILGALLGNACVLLDCFYVVNVMVQMEELDVSPDPAFLKRLEKFRENIRNMLVVKDRGGEVPQQMLTKDFENGWRAFNMIYTKWLQKIKVELPRHPWAQFKHKKA